jgi:hypothetical protein
MVRWYLRFNGYFTIENFYVHNPKKVFLEHVGDDTETDILGIRMPYSDEIAGTVKIANHAPLISGANGRSDVVIAEVKNVEGARPNSIWRHQEDADAVATISYILRFIGGWNEDRLQEIARSLIADFKFSDERFRVRYVMFSRSLSKGYADRVQHISFKEIVRFLDEQRGQCWKEHGLGVASTHNEWEPLITETFRILNGEDPPLERQKMVLRLLKNYGK